MTETQSSIDSYRRAAAENVGAALATVVRVEGSAYRRPGARMLVTEEGRTTGVLSGGCLERDVRERAAKVIETGEPIVVRYDTTSDDDIVWGSGSGCGGVVSVLIEPASDARLDGLMRLLNVCSEGRRRVALATVIHQEGETDVSVGARALRYPDGAGAPGPSSSGADIFPTACVLRDLDEAMRSGVSAVRRYESGGGSVEAFIEVVEPPVPLVVFGDGDDALPVVALARKLGWHTTVVDTRARPGSAERFAAADAVVLCRPEEACERVTFTERTAAVLMTHNYLYDLELLRALLNKRVRYVGCVGPRRRAERLLSELAGGDAATAVRYPGQLYAPAGLDIGAETPAEIAFSIVAEIRAVLAGREGGLLRNRKGAIHTKPREQSTGLGWPKRTGQGCRMARRRLHRLDRPLRSQRGAVQPDIP
jgi:xanthine/CO dehydrogenase XdhC/CoxF family maturation factor